MMNELTQIIAHESIGEVQETLQFLLEECSLDQAPSREEVAQWQSILTQRGKSFAPLVKLCQQFLDETA